MTDRPDSRRYDVQLFAVVRLDMASVEAASQREAVKRALERVDLSAQLAGPGFEYADELSHFQVDVAGDKRHHESQWFHSQDAPLLANLAQLIAWHDGARAEDDLQRIVRNARDALANTV